ncbi:hypothetical protein B0H12DRAFT_1230078 [Mycena haematopus]|nr:hypothetical protein B0H12DRAFT_1230078 [Mycena haematopus]
MKLNEAAIWAVRAPASTTAEMDDQIKTFRKWFSLIPRADGSGSRTFVRLRRHIMLSPLNSLRLIKEFGLIAAEKGYARTRTPTSPLWSKTAFDIVTVAVKTLADASRFDHAVQLIPDPTETHFHLRPDSYFYLDLRKRAGSNLAASLLSLRKAFTKRLVSSADPPNPLTIVGFLEAYLASRRTRAIPLLRNLALGRGGGHIVSYIFAEMLFHARRENPDLVIQTFVTHFFIVGLPREEILLRLESMERDPITEALWSAAPQMKLFPHPMHVAVVWRALLDLTHDNAALEALYAKVLKFADLTSPQAPVLAAGIPLLHPPPAWKTGVAASVFTPFMQRMCRAFGTERGALILKDMVRLGIPPNIYQLTQLAIEYARAGEAREGDEETDSAEGADGEAARRRTQRNLLPPVDQVFYRAVVRGFLISKRLAEARSVEQRMFKRYGYVPGEDQYADELYEDLRAAEERFASRKTPIYVAQSPKYHASLSALRVSRGPASSAGV